MVWHAKAVEKLTGLDSRNKCELVRLHLVKVGRRLLGMVCCGIVAAVISYSCVCVGGELCGVAEVALETFAWKKSYNTEQNTIASLLKLE